MKRSPVLAVVVLLVSVLGACASPPRNPVPLDEADGAQIPGIPDARFWGDTPPANLDMLVQEILEQRRQSGLNQTGAILAVSGGGDDGAFAAGILTAWTELGTRPEFYTVTGVSTGALTAPFAFLGSDYDDELQKMYGGFSADEIYTIRDWLSIFPKASVADSAPLAKLIAEIADEELLEKIAQEYRRGRRLFVQSTDLDSQRPVIWNLGAIAASDAPNALDVFHQALLASASMPVLFPPVLVQVETNSGLYDELHVDGGVISESTVLAAWQPSVQEALIASQTETDKPTFYLLRNGKISPESKVTDYDILEIAGRSISTLIKAQGIDNILGAYDAAEVRNGDFYATWIGDDFSHDYPGPFDPGYMKALYQYGYDLMKGGNAWHTEPPIITRSSQ